MYAKSLFFGTVFVSSCLGSGPQTGTIERCGFEPDPGDAYVDELFLVDGRIEITWDYVGCEDATFRLCWDGEMDEFFDNPDVTVKVHVEDPDHDTPDCWGNRHFPVVSYDYDVIRDAALAYDPTATEVSIWLEGTREDYPL